jgi:O-antigen/teichoic acid export membrane protein
MLDAHPDIAIFPETWCYSVLDRLGCLKEFTDPWQTSLFFAEVWQNLRSARDPAARVVAREASKQARYVGPTASVLEQLGQAYADERHAKIWGEKTPAHALWLPQIRDLFPRARLLFMVRDPRDVLVSYDDRWNFGRRDVGYLITTAALLKFYLVHLLNRQAFPPEQVHWVRYEALTRQPSVELGQICDFLGVDFEPSMLAFYLHHQNVERDMFDGRYHLFLSKPATTEHIGRYQSVFRPSQIALVERLLGDEMLSLGYSLSNISGLSFTVEEERAFAKAERYYQQLLSGGVRKKHRRRGNLKLRAYQMFGRALGLVPSWRIPSTGQDWRLLATEPRSPEAIPSSSATAPSASTPPRSETHNFRVEMGRISRHSGIAFAGTIFTAVLGYGFKIYIARMLGANALGLFALGMTIVSFLGNFNVLGLPGAAVRFVALYSASNRVRELRTLLWNGSWILLTTNLIFAALLIGAGPWIAIRVYHSAELVRYLPLFAPIMILSAMTLFFGNVLAGYREVGRRTMITSFVGGPITMAVSVLLITMGGGLDGYLTAQIVGATVVVVLLVSAVWQFTPVAAKSPDTKNLWIGPELWSFASVMLGLGVMRFLIGQTDRIALGIYRGAHDVGVYAVAASLVAYEAIILQSVNQIFAPVIADIHARGEHAVLGRLFQTLTKWMLGLTLPLATVMIVYARPIMHLFGHDFDAGWPILIIGTCGQLVNCGVGSVGNLLIMSGNERRLMRVQIAMAVVMTIGSAALVPLWGIYGAAVAAAITNVGMNAFNLLEVRKALGISPYNRSYLHLFLPTAATLALTLVLKKWAFVFRHDWLAVGVALGLAYCIFPAVFYFIAGLDADDRLIASALRSRMKTALGRTGAQA